MKFEVSYYAAFHKMVDVVEANSKEEAIAIIREASNLLVQIEYVREVVL